MAFSVLAFIATAVSVVSAQATFTRAGVAASSPDYGESVLVILFPM